MSILHKRILDYFFGTFLFISSLILCSALIMDKILGFEPCHLCIYERIPYLMIAIVSALYFFVRNYYALLLKIMSVVAICGALLATYHTGVEREWWDPSSKCTPAIKIADSLSYSDYKKALENAEIGDCSKPALKIFSLSLAEYNIIFNLIFLALIIQMIKRYDSSEIQ